MPRPSSLSLERKIPLLMSVLLVALAVGMTVAGYSEVRQSSEMRGIDRIQRMVTQLSSMATTSTQARFAELQRVASDPRVIAYLSSDAPSESAQAAARQVLETITRGPAESAVVVQLRSARETRRIATAPELAHDEEPAAALLRQLSGGRVAMGRFYTHDNGVYYWVGAPVLSQHRVLGYLLQRRTISPSARAEQTIRELSGGDSVSLYLVQDSVAFWASLSGSPVPPPRLVEPHENGEAENVVRYARDGGGRYVAVFASVPNTPIRVLAETPVAVFAQRPTVYLRRSIAVALSMLVIGIAAAWILSRRITRPIRALTAAADAISAGRYDHRAPLLRRDETGRLADAFNTMAEQVQRSHADLERQIAESRDLALRLDEANRAKADFLATMSHELRTPLNAIGGYVDLIELGVRGPVTEEMRRDLDRVRYNQRHLLTLIGNILDFTRLDGHTLSFDIDDVRVDRVVTEVVTAIAPLLDEKELNRRCVGCDEPLVARADRGRLEQVLLNLMSNAIRFTPPGGLITIEMAPRDDAVAIVVADTGIGIPPEKLEAIFEPFVQVQSGLTRTVGGTGLGLTISRALARAMGGDLVAESDGSSWARFTLTLPAAARPLVDRADEMLAAT